MSVKGQRDQCKKMLAYFKIRALTIVVIRTKISWPSLTKNLSIARSELMETYKELELTFCQFLCVSACVSCTVTVPQTMLFGRRWRAEC